MIKLGNLLGFAALIAVMAGCSYNKQEQEIDRDCLYQISTLQALTAGDFYGSATIENFLEHGNIGIGTFDCAEGEMIVLDGVCYQALADGRVITPSLTTTIPFAGVTWFDADITQQFNSEFSFEELKTALSEIVLKNGGNAFYVMKMNGTFPEMRVRSIIKQKEPYKTLDEVVKTDQIVFDYKDVTGTLIALYCPPYVSGVNAVGWHMHFLSSDKKTGGHVLDLQMSEGFMELDRTDRFMMNLPESEYFDSLDLTGREEAVNAVEK